jgi:very-short-patch-repair endonuclease
MSDYPFFHDAPPDSFERARQSRGNKTSAAKDLWKHLRKKQLGGFQFRRQHPVDQFILDFYCHEARLAVEADGFVHVPIDQKMYDQERDRIIHELGIKVMRFRNGEIFNSRSAVLNKIQTEASNPSQLFNSPNTPKSSPNGEDLRGVNP